MLSVYQLKIADLYNISIGNVKKLVPNSFDKEKQAIHYENFQLYLKFGLKPKKIHHVLEFNQSQKLKQYVEFKTEEKIEAEKNGDKGGKALYKLMNYAVHRKTMKNLTSSLSNINLRKT